MSFAQFILKRQLFRQQKIQLLILVLPVGFLTLFLMLPLMQILFLAFNVELNHFPPSFDLEFLLDVLNDPLNQYFFKWTLQQAILSTVSCIILGLPGSYFLTRYSIPGKQVLRNVLTVPFILPPIVVLMGFIVVFGHGGWVNASWRELTGEPLLNIYNSYEGILLAHVFYNIPVILRLTEIGWMSIDPDLEDVARSLNGSRWQIFRHVQLPHLLPSLAAGALIVFIYTFNSFAIVLVLGGVKFQTLEVRIYSLAKGRFDYNSAAALTLVQLLVNIIVILVYLHVIARHEVNLGSDSQRWNRMLPFISTPFSVKSIMRSVAMSIYFIVLAIISVLPMIGVLVQSLQGSNGELTLRNYQRIFDLSLRSFIGMDPVNMIMNSLAFAVMTMIIAVILALLLNYGMHYETTVIGTPRLASLQSLGALIVILPLTISAVTLAFSLFSIYHLTPIYEHPSLVIVIAHVLVAFPFANRVIAAARNMIDPELLNVSRSLGRSRLMTFLKVELPLMLPALMVAMMFSFAISLGEFGATSFISRANFATIPIGVYRLINTRRIGEAAAFSSILMFVTVGTFLFIERVGKLELRF